MTAAQKRHDDDDSFDFSRAQLVRRGSRRGRPSRMTLRALRVACDKTQEDISEAARIGQGDVSKLERRTSLDEFVVSTLRRYVEALGGTLEIVVVLPRGHRIALAPSEGEE